MKFTIPGQPLPKQRPRFGQRGRVYSPSKKEEERVFKHVRFQLPLHFKPLSGRIQIRADFYRKDKRRVDGDNLGKLVADALNGLVWVDDSHLRHWIVNIYYDKENPRTEVEVKEYKE